MASGFIAGGALFGVFSALLTYFGINFVNPAWVKSHAAEALGLAVYAMLTGYFIWSTLRTKAGSKG
jgi:Na+/H+ antiporter NhaC